jgi:hypothetical protein
MIFRPHDNYQVLNSHHLNVNGKIDTKGNENELLCVRKITSIMTLTLNFFHLLQKSQHGNCLKFYAV